MEIYKICPTCSEKNSINNYLCDSCMADISSIEHTSKDKLNNINQKTKLTLVSNSFSIEIYDGDILGREYKGKDFFQAYNTISRKHASVHLKDGEWFILDLNSSNGIYINGKKIIPSIHTTIQHNDIISLSLKFSAKVIF